MTEDNHKDALGNDIIETSKLAVARRNDIVICSILKMTPKMLRVTPIRASYKGKGYLVYGNQTVVVDGPDVTAYILRKA